MLAIQPFSKAGWMEWWMDEWMNGMIEMYGFPYHPYIDSTIILSDNNIILLGFKTGMSSVIINNDYK